MEVRNFVDPHTHHFFSNYTTIELLKATGYRAIISLAYFPLQPSSPETLIDLFNWMIEVEPERFHENRIRYYVGIGIHPRCIPPNYKKCLEHIRKLCNNELLVAIGEIGLETASKIEVKVFKEQLELAMDIDRPVVIHTPRKMKDEILEKTFNTIDEVEFPHERALIDHLVKHEQVEHVIEEGYYAGLTVQPGKLDHIDAADIVERLRTRYRKMIIDSDCGRDPSKPTAVAECAKYLLERKLPKRIIKYICAKNAIELFKLPIL